MQLISTQAKALAGECCNIMAVVTAKLRALAISLCSSSSSPSAAIARIHRSRLCLASAKRHVRRLAAAAAPATPNSSNYGDDYEDDGTLGTTTEGLSSSSPGLSLVHVAALSEKLQRDSHRVSSSNLPPPGSRPADISVGSAALIGACTAFHMHLLEWIRITDKGEDRGTDGGEVVDTVAESSTTDAFPGGFMRGGNGGVLGSCVL